MSYSLFQAYKKGWVNGVQGVSSDQNRLRLEEFTNLKVAEDLKAEYARGYDEGRAVRALALKQAAERLDYKPSILREVLETVKERKRK